MKRQRLMSRIGLVLGHGGYILGLLEYGVTDIIWLRIFAIGGCGMVVGYQLLQPRVQWISATWCFIYVAVNVFQLATSMGSPAAPLSWEEARLHGCFSRHVTVGQFSKLLALGEWLWLVDGAILAEEGQTSRGSCLFFITEGSCDVSVGGRTVAQIGPGSVVGEASLLFAERAVSATVTSLDSVRCFAVPVAKVQELLEAEPELRVPLERIFMDTLAAKVVAMNEQVRARSYQAVLEVACTLDGRDGMAAGVAEYRSRHAVPDELHARLMEELPQCAHKPFRVWPSEGQAAPRA